MKERKHQYDGLQLVYYLTDKKLELQKSEYDPDTNTAIEGRSLGTGVSGLAIVDLEILCML